MMLLPLMDGQETDVSASSASQAAGKGAHGAPRPSLSRRSASCAGIEPLRDGLKVLASGPQLSLVFGIIGIGNL